MPLQDDAGLITIIRIRIRSKSRIKPQSAMTTGGVPGTAMTTGGVPGAIDDQS